MKILEAFVQLKVKDPQDSTLDGDLVLGPNFMHALMKEEVACKADLSWLLSNGQSVLSILENNILE